MINKSETLIHFAEYFGYPQISLKPIRERQNIKLIDKIMHSTEEHLREKGGNLVKKPLFFAGSVDFMVKNEDGLKEYYVLETNGGSSRGYSTLPEKYWSKAYDSYAETLDFVKTKNPVVIIGAPPADLIYYEKILLSEHIVKKMLRNNSIDAKAVMIKDLTEKQLKKGNVVITGSYSEIIPRLNVKGKTVYLDNKKVDVLIGDGIARRKPEIVRYLLKNELKTIVVNDIFFITDDKSLTYLAVNKAKKELNDYSIYPIGFEKAYSKTELKNSIKSMLNKNSEILIKPHGGSGGSGIDIISENDDVDKKINGSLIHYAKKFGKNRQPYPYTVCQRVKATPVDWKSGKHQYDIRVYVRRHKNKILPAGALMRIAIEPFTGIFTKKSFVVNLSGYEGVDTDRGFGISRQSLSLFELTEKDFVNMFSAASVLMAYICNNYKTLVKETHEV
jgi:hypothetical protein